MTHKIFEQLISYGLSSRAADEWNGSLGHRIFKLARVFASMSGKAYPRKTCLVYSGLVKYLKNMSQDPNP